MAPLRSSPRLRRLHADSRAIEELANLSSILALAVVGSPPDRYVLTFQGPGTVRDPASGEVRLAYDHRVEVRMGAEYPRLKPDLRWRTPLFHPNISASGAVCLGGYTSNWVPSVMLSTLCEMLWDMLRYANFDIRNPFNRLAAQWAGAQTAFSFPLDPRPLRDLLAGSRDAGGEGAGGKRPSRPDPEPGTGGILFIDGE